MSIYIMTASVALTFHQKNTGNLDTVNGTMLIYDYKRYWKMIDD